MNIYNYTIKELIRRKAKTPKELDKIKREMAKTFNTSCSSNILLLKAYHNLLKKKRIKKSRNLEEILRKRPVRSLSGVVVVSALTKPYPCPGECIFCPSEKGFPKSYLKGEPAAERAKRLKFNPYLQVKKRLESLENQGHPTDKIELRIIGASFSAYPKNYKIHFLANLFAAANGNKELKKGTKENLKKEQKTNEKTKHRIVGISIETRPDLINKKEIVLQRELGVTLVELGIQTVFDDVLKKCKRGHGTKEIAKATKLLKDSGFKIMYQIMPNLPGSNIEKDLKAFKTIFGDQRFKPDWIKIYPCLVCEGTELYNLWRKKRYKPYTNKELKDLLIKIKTNLPCWVRVARLFRDIPANQIKAGSKLSNLREVIQEEMKKKGLKCNCIRCKEVKENPKGKAYLFKETYEASDGKEIFLSFENKKRTKLFAFLRLRVPSQTILPVLKNSSLIRELHTYGQQVPLKEKSLAIQHKGFGKKLEKEAEKTSKKSIMAVISGIGAREYYRKLGYKLKDTYMIKRLK